MSKGDATRDTVSQCLEDLAKTIGLEFGAVQVTISEGKAVKYGIEQHYLGCCIERRSGKWRWTGVGNTGELDMSLAQQFVSLHLEPLLASLVGRFGYLEAYIEDGKVIELSLVTFYGTSRRRPRRRRLALLHR